MTLRNRIQELLNGKGIKLSVVEQEETPVTLTVVGKLADGTELYGEGELAVDSMVNVKNADGTEVPAPDGEHTLEDGRVIVVAGGKVIEIKDAEPADLTSEELMQAITELSAEIEKRNSRITELETELEAVKATSAKVSQEKVTVEAQLAALKNKPAATSVTQAATEKKEEKKSDKPKLGSKEYYLEMLSKNN